MSLFCKRAYGELFVVETIESRNAKVVVVIVVAMTRIILKIMAKSAGNVALGPRLGCKRSSLISRSFPLSD